MGHFFISGRIGLSQEVKRMKRKNRFSELLRPLGALALAGATLWTVSVTAGSATAADAWAALRQEMLEDTEKKIAAGLDGEPMKEY